MSIMNKEHSPEDYERIERELGLALARDEKPHDNIGAALRILQKEGLAMYEDEVYDLLDFVKVVGANSGIDGRDPIVALGAIMDAWKTMTRNFSSRGH